MMIIYDIHRGVVGEEMLRRQINSIEVRKLKSIDANGGFNINS